jgi:hypothetical protein
MLVALQLVTVAVVPLNSTLFVPCVDPKFVPVIVTTVPIDPLVGLRFVMLGAASDKIIWAYVSACEYSWTLFAAFWRSSSS